MLTYATLYYTSYLQHALLQYYDHVFSLQIEVADKVAIKRTSIDKFSASNSEGHKLLTAHHRHMSNVFTSYNGTSTPTFDGL